MPIDRVFTVSGFGTVITGTLLDGDVEIGQELLVYPRERAARVRGLQSHNRKVDRAAPGSRVAVNISGLAVEDIQRGDVLASPRALKSSHRVDGRLRLLSSSPITLEQNDRVDFFVGAAEVPARVTLLDRERIEPDDEAWVQFRFREQVAVLKGDRFIVRRASPSMTIGGGEIIDPNPKRHKRFRRDVIGALETLAAGSPDEVVLQLLESVPKELRALSSELPNGLNEQQITSALEELIAEGDVRALVGNRAGGLRPNDYLVATTTWDKFAKTLVSTLSEFHRTQPLRRGMPAEELRSRLKLGRPPRLFEEALATAANDGIIASDGTTIRLADFSISLDTTRRAAADRYLAALKQFPYSPPSPSDFAIDVDTIGALVDLGELVKVADDIVYTPVTYASIERDVLAIIDRDGSITLAQFRDHFATSRKYAQATLEFLDQRRLTRRVGDSRVRYAGNSARNQEDE